MSHCVITSEYYVGDDWLPPINCPNCGRFLKWNPDEGLFSCVCNGIIHHRTTGDPEEDKEYIEEGDEDSLPLAICKKPDGWKDEWGPWLIPEKLQSMGGTET